MKARRYGEASDHAARRGQRSQAPSCPSAVERKIALAVSTEVGAKSACCRYDSMGGVVATKAWGSGWRAEERRGPQAKRRDAGETQGHCGRGEGGDSEWGMRETRGIGTLLKYLRNRTNNEGQGVVSSPCRGPSTVLEGSRELLLTTGFTRSSVWVLYSIGDIQLARAH